MKLPTLPSPPVLKRFQDKSAPPWLRAEKVKPLEQAREVGISAADWIDERTSLSGVLAGCSSARCRRGRTGLHARLGDDVRVRHPRTRPAKAESR